ncbi:hypothetical protein ACQQ2N_03015 [Dokdonella sp. MW10]|uniref:hypothetical protein n=1 Tax=Dokdonella sp. MW10 TaxID=2992926 RepID=UPI003F81F262
MPHEPGRLRLLALRGTYLVIAVGLASTFWPLIVSPPNVEAGPSSVVRALLAAIALGSAIGVRHPLRMLPLLGFEFAWKTIWLLAVAWPASRAGALDEYASETVFACLIGVVLVGLVMPWRHVWRVMRSPAY